MGSEADFRARLSRIRAVLFDWDGVFNDGWKDQEGGSPFSEVGSMGVNMLRFGLWLQNKEQLPYAAVITGQHNAFAEKFTQREKLHGVYIGYIDKREAFDDFVQKHNLKGEEVAFFFDDAIDLAVADRCGLRILMWSAAGERFAQHAIARGSVDMATSLSGGQNGLREATDTLLTLMGRYGEAIDNRAAYSETYQRYLTQRQAAVPEVLKASR
ncbi:MAG: phosphatase [Flavobacteriales bacterium]|nr:phosphatase [Flavobacteriales bacterium]